MMEYQQVLINHLDSRTIGFNMIFVQMSIDQGLIPSLGPALLRTVLTLIKSDRPYVTINVPYQHDSASMNCFHFSVS